MTTNATGEKDKCIDYNIMYCMAVCITTAILTNQLKLVKYIVHSVKAVLCHSCMYCIQDNISDG